jgi:ATP-dependent RNA circularization protein (DNA/RNA ligase family)
LAAQKANLEQKLSQRPGIVLFGEVFGKVQDLKYDRELDFAAFDAYSMKENRYLDFQEFAYLCIELGIKMAPILYRGPWKPELAELRNGKSELANHLREGFVIRPTIEKWDLEIGRLILKYVGEDYLERK